MSSADEVKDMLISRGIREEDAQKLYDENVDGDSFVDLTEDDLKSLQIKLGDRKKIFRIVQEKKRQSEEYITITTVLNSDSIQNVTDVSFESENGAILVEKGCISDISANLTLNSENDIPQTLSSNITQQNISNANVGPSTSVYQIVPFSSPEAINIQDVLNKVPQGKMLLQLFQKPDSIINRKYVSELVRICVNAMVKDLETLYPTSLQKENLAKAIVKAFPVLKSSREKVEGYEHFFDRTSRSGLIEWRLKTLRVKLSPSKKKNRKRAGARLEINEEEDLSFEDDDVSLAAKITWLQYVSPTSIHKSEILETMKETYSVRRNFIRKENPSITQILKKYPRFKDFGGILIDAEFKLIHPAARDLLAVFPVQYAPRILKYTRQNRLDVFERLSVVVDENFGALLMLADLLPITGFRKKRKISGSQSLTALFPCDALVRFIGVNGNLEEAIEAISENQPYLVCAGEKDVGGNFFLILDSHAVDVGNCGLKAVDCLYKSHYVFNVKYMEQLASYYNFMDYIIYKLLNGPARSSVENLSTLFNAV